MDATANDTTSKTRFAKLSEYFFGEEVPYGMALLRMVLPPVLLIDLFYRHPWARELYSTDGAPAPLGVNFQIPGLLPEFSGGLVVALHAVLIAAMVCASLGWCTRISLAIGTLLYTYFGLLDSLSTVTKYTVIATHMLLLLSVSSCGQLWSIDAWLERRRNRLDLTAPTTAPVWPARLLQLLVGIVYLGAAITKMHTPSFFSGDQLMYWTMTYVNNVHPLGDWLSQYPLVLSVFGYITIVWEIAFVFMIFHPAMKWWAIAIGAFFHLMTMFTLGLYVFPMVMFSSYLAYVMAGEWKTISSWRLSQSLADLPRTVSGWLDRVFPAPSETQRAWTKPAGYALTLAVVGLAATEIEYWRDPYQQRGPNGPLALEPISQEEVARLFEPDRPIRPSDKLLAFDLGTLQIGEHLSNRRNEFRHGEKIIAQATISPPHEDMWLDCWLHETRPGSEPGELVPGRSVTKVGQAVAREVFRANFLFQVDESLPPGDYYLRLRSGRDDIALKRFTLLPRAGNAPPAAAPLEDTSDELSAN